MVWQLVVGAVRVYAPWIMLPVTITVGYIGYSLEWMIRKPRNLEGPRSIQEQREERRLEELKK